MKKKPPFLFSTEVKNWCWLYALTLLCYLPFISIFLWGNHDWQWVKEYTPLWSGVFEGRFSQFFLQTLLFEGKILPIITILTGFAIYSAAAILLLKLWNLPNFHYSFILLGLLITTAPYTISWLYFAFITLSCLSWPFFIILGFWLLKTNPTKTKKLCAILLFTLALGGYPPVINIIGIIFFSLLLIDLCIKKTNVALILKEYSHKSIIILLALILFFSILFILKKLHLWEDTYNTNSIILHDIPLKISYAASIAVKQFITATSFISHTYKYLMLYITVCAFLYLFWQLPKKISTILLFTFATAGLFLSSVITVFSAANINYVALEPRIEFFGLLYIYIFAAAIIIQYPNIIIRNSATVIFCLLIYSNFCNISYAAKVWRLGFNAEIALSERIISRIEEAEKFDYNHSYTFIQGGLLNFRSRFYNPLDITIRQDSYTLNAPFIPWHLPSKAYKFYYPKDIFGADFDIFWSYINPSQINISPELTHYLKYQARPWPYKNAIYVDEQTIILTLTTTGQQQGQNWINQR